MNKEQSLQGTGPPAGVRTYQTPQFSQGTLTVWRDPSIDAAEDDAIESLERSGYTIESRKPMTRETLQKLDPKTFSQTETIRTGGELLIILGNGWSIRDDVALWIRLILQWLQAAYSARSDNRVRVRILSYSTSFWKKHESGNPELGEAALEFRQKVAGLASNYAEVLDLEQTDSTPEERVKRSLAFSNSLVLTTFSGPQSLQMALAGAYPPAPGKEHTTWSHLGPDNFRVPTINFTTLDRNGLLSRITWVAGELGFNIQLLSLDKNEPYASGYLSGSFDDVDAKEIPQRLELLREACGPEVLNPSLGRTPTDILNWNQRQAQWRRIRIWPVPARANQAGPILSEISGIGSDVRSIEIKSRVLPNRLLQLLEIEIDVAPLSFERREELYAQIRAVNPGDHLGSTIYRELKGLKLPQKFVNITSIRGDVSDDELELLDPRYTRNLAKNS